MEKALVQWHPAFCSALKLELMQNKNDLLFQSEVVLNSGPIKMDLLVIQKTADVVIQNQIGAIFRGYNIFEYKSPDDELNIDTFFKGLAYACLYKANGKFVNSIKINDLSLTFLRKRNPRGLFSELEKNGIVVNKRMDGIYNIFGFPGLAIQIVVSRELDWEEHTWLTALSDDLSVDAASHLIEKVSALAQKDDKMNADALLEVAMNKNKIVFSEIKEVDAVCEALRELMKPEIEEELKAGRQAGRQEGLQEGLQEGRQEGRQEGLQEAISKLMENLDISFEKALEVLKIPTEERKLYHP